MKNDNTNKFNPLLADTPDVQIQIVTTPSIGLIKTYSDGTTESQALTNSESESNTSSRSNTNSNTKTWEGGFTVGASVTKNWGVTNGGAQGSVSVNASTSWKWVRGDTTSFSNSEAQSIASTYAETKSKAATKTENYTGGVVSVGIKIKNNSNVAYVLNNIMLEAYKISYGNNNEQTETAATNLYPTTAAAAEPTLLNATIPAGGETGVIKFSSAQLPVAAIESIMNGLVGFKIDVSSIKISSEDTKDFTKITTAVDAKTALLTVDYGPCFDSTIMPIAKSLPETKSFQIATKRTPLSLEETTPVTYKELTLTEALSDCLPNVVTWYTDEKNHKMIKSIYEVEGKATNPEGMEGDWFIAVITYENGIADVKYYGPSEEKYYYNADQIIVRAGDDITVMYSVDKDKDGIPLREEELFGTSDDSTDTDGDTISDYDELTGWTVAQTGTVTCTNPALKDTDGDGVNDNEDPYPTVSSVLSNAYLKSIDISYNPFNSRPFDTGSTLNLDVGLWDSEVLKNRECEVLLLKSIDGNATNSDGSSQYAFTLKGGEIPSSAFLLQPKVSHGSANYEYYLIRGWAEKDSSYNEIEGEKTYGNKTYAGITKEEYNNMILLSASGNEEGNLDLTSLPIGKFKIAVKVSSSDKANHVWYIIRFDSPLEVPSHTMAGISATDGENAKVSLSWAKITESRATNLLIVRYLGNNPGTNYVPDHNYIVNAENTTLQTDTESSPYYMVVPRDQTSAMDEIAWANGYWYYFYTYYKDSNTNTYYVSKSGSPINAIAEIPDTFTVSAKFERLTITDDFGDEGHSFELKWTIWQSTDGGTEVLVNDHDQEWKGDYDNIRQSNWYSLVNDECTAVFQNIKKNQDCRMNIHVRLREIDDGAEDDDIDNINIDLFYDSKTKTLKYDGEKHNTGADSSSNLNPVEFTFGNQTPVRFSFNTKNGNKSVAGYFDLTLLWAK